MQWVQKVQIPEKYVIMSEPDHVWLKCAACLHVLNTCMQMPHNLLHVRML